MKIKSLFILVITFLLSYNNISAQSASVLWPLTVDQNPINPSVNIQANSEIIGAGPAPSMTVFAYNNGQRLWVGNTGWLAGSLEPTRFIQFDASPTAGYDFNVTNVSFNYGDFPLATDFNILNSQVFYSIDGWQTSTVIGSTIIYKNTIVQTFSQSLNVTVPNGQSFSLRIYPYSPSGGNAGTPTFAIHSNVIIEGTTAEAISDSCAVDSINVSTGWNHNTNSNYFANNPATDQDVFWTLISAPTNNGNVNLNGPAWVITKHPAWINQSGSRWISAFQTSGSNARNIDEIIPPYVFQKSICVSDTTDLTFDLNVLVDNRIVINFVDSNGNLISNLGALNSSITSNFTVPTNFLQLVNNVAPGTYYIRVELRNDNSGSAMGFNIQGTVTGGNSSLLETLCCNPPNSSITGYKFNDLNNNGIKESNEQALPGWVITLTGSGISSITSTTDANGSYLFTGLPPGTYTLTETSQSGWIAGQTGSSKTVTVGTNQAINNINFGNRQLPLVGSICGVKFNDLNGNGIKDNGEPGLENWEIKLSGSFNQTALTDVNGEYCFTNLATGNYTVSETYQNNWQQTYPSAPGIHTVNLSSGQNVSDIDFGNKLNDAIGCVEPPSGMVAWWPMDETLGATVVLDIKGNNNGTPFPGAIGTIGSPVAGAVPGNTLQFLNPQAKVDGSLFFVNSAVLKYIKVPDSPALNFGTGDFTIDAWVYPVVVNSFRVEPIVQKVELTTPVCTGYRLYIQGGNLHFVVMDGSSTSIISTPITYSQWQHIAAVRKGGTPNTFELYINGVLTAFTNGQINNTSNSAELILGGIPSPSGGAICGLPAQYGWGEIAIDELEIFNRALDQSEIFSLWHADTLGKCKPDLTSINEDPSSRIIQTNFFLNQNYPNPFNPSTTINYTLPIESKVKISVFNLLGELIVTIVDGFKQSGNYKVEWNANNFPSGLYFYKIEAIPQNGYDSFIQVKKMILLK